MSRNSVQMHIVSSSLDGVACVQRQVFDKTLSFYFALQEYGCALQPTSNFSTDNPDEPASDESVGLAFDDMLQHFHSDRQYRKVVVCTGKV